MVYKFVVLSDEDDSFVREFELLDRQTLLDFHNILQEELEFDKSQMASFYLASNNWEKEEEFTLIDMGAGSSTMEDAVLEEIIYKKNQKLLYVFDFFNERALFIEYVGDAKEVEGRQYPVCTNSKGLPPKQIVFGTGSRRNLSPLTIDDEEEEEDIDVDDVFFNGDEDEGLGDFESFDQAEEEE
ncbi:MAG TPA: hypothetical protein P5320_05745 [Bacteroidales bacterium]|nr:hypothetical protein [Bacteroidales bacterium]HOK75150.1 hypothetical protein [Bacteroidales bacterium]HOM39948.1 hypothetical protein [Bacteroidales bacterium]HPP92304.1 hypothetical protein [Bacteroidales bacterium]HRR16207.1 hypothetical protein [Bacteroidales bacterium]